MSVIRCFIARLASYNPWDDSSPEGAIGTVRGFYLFPLLLGPILVGLGLMMLVLDTRDHALDLAFAAAGVPMFILGLWMRRALAAKNPRAWHVHAALGWPILALSELMWIGLLCDEWSGGHRFGGVGYFAFMNLYLTLPGVRLQRRWMSLEMKLWFGISPCPSETPCVPEK